MTGPVVQVDVMFPDGTRVTVDERLAAAVEGDLVQPLGVAEAWLVSKRRWAESLMGIVVTLEVEPQEPPA